MPPAQTRGRASRSWFAALNACAIVLIVFASRLPYLRPGFGTDPDAYRVVLAARTLRAGDYAVSRPPAAGARSVL